jgi:hypothetical protein
VFKTGVGHNGKPFLDLSGCVGVARKNNYLLYVVRTFERIDPFSENDIKTTFSLLAIAADWSASTTSGAPILLASGEHSITDNFDIKSAQGLFVFNPEASDGMGICGTMQVMRATIGWDADTGTPLGTLSVESVPYVDIEAFSQKIVAVDYVAGVATYMVLSTYTTGLVRVYGDPFYCTNDGTPEGVILAEAQNFTETATEIRNLAANGVTVDAYTYELTATVVYTFNAECDTTFTRSESLSITGGWQLIAADMRGGVYYIRQHDGAIQENGAPICSIPDLSSYTGVAAFSEYGPGVLAASIYDNSVEGVLTHMDTITRLRCNGEFSDATGLLGTVGAIDTTGITTDYLGDIWGAHLPLYRLGVIRYQALPA